jgi:hypothetical protein
VKLYGDGRKKKHPRDVDGTNMKTPKDINKKLVELENLQRSDPSYDEYIEGWRNALGWVMDLVVINQQYNNIIK